MPLLSVNKLCVEVAGREILHAVSFDIEAGKTWVLLGPNGSGKTTLIMALMGFPGYRVTSGSVHFRGKDLLPLRLDERAREGMGMLFQRPPVVRGVKLRSLLSTLGADEGQATALADLLNLRSFLDRDLNHGFSGGEIKRSELLQLLAQAPQLVLMDEPESGVDMENVALMGMMANRLLEKHLREGRTRAGLIVTHTGFILDHVKADGGLVLVGGELLCSGDPHEILQAVREHGYSGCLRCDKR